MFNCAIIDLLCGIKETKCGGIYLHRALNNSDENNNKRSTVLVHLKNYTLVYDNSTIIL